MSQKYIICSCCGRKIPMGEEVWYHYGYCGTFCSAQCYADCYAEQDILDEELAEDNGCEIYDDEQRKIDLLKEMQELTEKLTKVKFELDTLQ